MCEYWPLIASGAAALAVAVGYLIGSACATSYIGGRLRDGEVVRFEDGTLATKTNWKAP
jgi:hypothetical protein